MEEKEVKYLGIDVEEVSKKLSKISARKVFDKLYKRKVYDYPDLRLNSNYSWIRLRDEDGQVTLAYKRREGVSSSDGTANDTSMTEVELIVNDFVSTSLFLESIGLKLKFYEENRRVRWVKNGVEFDIDYWPKLDPYLEIEASSWDEIDKSIKDLGLDPNKKRIFSAHQIYKLAGINEDDYSEITFNRMVLKRK